jgi:hypothetical protein
LSDSYAPAGCAGVKAGQEEAGDRNNLEQTGYIRDVKTAKTNKKI